MALTETQQKFIVDKIVAKAVSMADNRVAARAGTDEDDVKSVLKAVAKDLNARAK